MARGIMESFFKSNRECLFPIADGENYQVPRQEKIPSAGLKGKGVHRLLPKRVYYTIFREINLNTALLELFWQNL
jgi:hypothetical protein